MKFLLLLISALIGIDAHASSVIIANTNWGSTALTNRIRLQPAGPILTDGTWLITGPFQWFNSTNGLFTNSLLKGNYQLDIQGITVNVPGNTAAKDPILFAVPDGTNTYWLPTLLISGANTYNYTPGVRVLTSTNGSVTITDAGNGVSDLAAIGIANPNALTNSDTRAITLNGGLTVSGLSHALDLSAPANPTIYAHQTGPFVGVTDSYLRFSTPGLWWFYDYLNSTNSSVKTGPLIADSVTVTNGIITGDISGTTNTPLLPGIYEARRFGAVGDGVPLDDAFITNAVAKVYSPSASFASGDVGKTVILYTNLSIAASFTSPNTAINFSNTISDYLLTTIASVQDSTHATLSANSLATIQTRMVYGTDNTEASQSAIDSCLTNSGNGEVRYGKGIFLHAGALRNTSVQNSVLILPNFDTNAIYVTLRGVGNFGGGYSGYHAEGATKSGTILFVATKGTTNNPSFIGGDAAIGFSTVNLFVRDMELRMPANSSIGLIKIQHGGGIDMENVSLTSDFWGVWSNATYRGCGTNSNAFGLWAPDNSNNGILRLNKVWFSGLDRGLISSDHCVASGLFFAICNTGVYQPVNCQFGGSHISFVGCKNAVLGEPGGNAGPTDIHNGWFESNGTDLKDVHHVKASYVSSFALTYSPSTLNTLQLDDLSRDNHYISVLHSPHGADWFMDNANSGFFSENNIAMFHSPPTATFRSSVVVDSYLGNSTAIGFDYATGTTIRFGLYYQTNNATWEGFNGFVMNNELIGNRPFVLDETAPTHSLWISSNTVSTATGFSGDGSGLTGLNASQLTSGTLPAARLPALTGAVTTSSGSTATSLGSFTSAQLAGAVTDETGSGGGGLAVFNQSPTIFTPTIASMVNATHNHQNAAGGGTLTEAALALTDITTANVSTSAHGFAPKGTAGTTQFWRQDWTLATPGGGGVANTVTNAGGTIGTTLLKGDGGQGVVSAAFSDVQALAPGTIHTNGMSVAATLSNSLSVIDGANAQMVVSNGVIGTVKAITNTGALNVAGAIVGSNTLTIYNGATAKATISTAGTITIGGSLDASSSGDAAIAASGQFYWANSTRAAIASAAIGRITLRDQYNGVNFSRLSFGKEASTAPALWSSTNVTPSITIGASDGTSVANFLTTGTTIATNGFTSYTNALAVNTFTFPNTTVNWTNPVHVSIEVYIDLTAVTGTSVKKNGVQIYGGLSNDVSVGLRDGEYFSVTYSVGTPVGTWSVFP